MYGAWNMCSNNKPVNLFCFDGSHNTAELMYYDAGMTSVYRVFNRSNSKWSNIGIERLVPVSPPNSL